MGLPRGENNSFGISPEALETMFEERGLDDLYALGGVRGLAAVLRSDCASGVSLEESVSDGNVGGSPSERLRIFGCNRLPDRQTKTVLQLAWLALQDRVLILLTVVATISLVLGLYQTFGQPHQPGQPKVEWVEGTTIMTAVVIVVVVSALNDYQKERQFAKLHAKVRRQF
jgi:Ca2+-transporting ATPase